jgi:hypothetical protein
MFVYWYLEDAGSAQTIYNYSVAARELGHEVVLHAPETPRSRFNCSLDVASADAVIFLMEWNIYLHNNLPLDIERPISKSPRSKRIVIDDDGMYNSPIRVDVDYNHLDEEASQRRIDLYDSISDKIYQPSLHPLRSNVGTFLFHGYNPSSAIPLDFADKEYGMFYLGSNWFRWRPMRKILGAIEPIRDQIGRIGVVGHNWLEPPAGAESPLRERAYLSDANYFEKLGVEVMPAVPVDQVINCMSRGIFNPVLVRPLFNYLRLVNPRMFETPAANTIPLFGLDAEYVQEIYGADALGLVLADDASDRIADVTRRPEHYAQIVKGIRHHLAEKHSYKVRLQELIEIVMG